MSARLQRVPEGRAALCGGIDLGGSKIEARLFGGAEAATLATRRISTPQTGFAALVEALAAQVAWIEAQAQVQGETPGGTPLAIGVALPGIIAAGPGEPGPLAARPRDPASAATPSHRPAPDRTASSGLSRPARAGAGAGEGAQQGTGPERGEGADFTANLPRGAQALGSALEAATGRPLRLANDAMAFALSEARGGAGAGFRSVAGLVLGTGLGGGWCLDGALPPRAGGLAVELGHAPLSFRLRARHDLPLWPCGCGRTGCIETLASGPGLARLAELRLGRPCAPAELPASPGGRQILAIWAEVVAEALDLLRLSLAPDCVVLGGGLSNLPGVERLLSEALARLPFGPASAPPIRGARFGDSSGARGAALLARDG